MTTRSSEQPTEDSKATRILGRVLVGFVGLFLIIASGLPKFSFVDWQGKEAMMQEMMEHLGISMTLLPRIGAIEIAVAVLLWIPRTSFLGAVLTTGLLGGAVFSHIRVGDGVFEIVFPMILGVLMWTGFALRNRDLVDVALGRSSRPNR